VAYVRLKVISTKEFAEQSTRKSSCQTPADAPDDTAFNDRVQIAEKTGRRVEDTPQSANGHRRFCPQYEYTDASTFYDNT
jgi:hypothetical protein